MIQTAAIKTIVIAQEVPGSSRNTQRFGNQRLTVIDSPLRSWRSQQWKSLMAEQYELILL